MKILSFLIVFGAIASACERKTSSNPSENSTFPHGKWIDLTYTIDSTTLYWPNNASGFENVAHLDQLPTKGFYVVALPLKIGKGSGAPLRLAAFIKS